MKNILITGATSGLGLMLSRHYDSKGFNLIAVGKDIKKLKMLKNEVSSKNKKNCYSLDFNVRKNYEKFIKCSFSIVFTFLNR